MQSGWARPLTGWLWHYFPYPAVSACGNWISNRPKQHLAAVPPRRVCQACYERCLGDIRDKQKQVAGERPRKSSGVSLKAETVTGKSSTWVGGFSSLPERCGGGTSAGRVQGPFEFTFTGRDVRLAGQCTDQRTAERIRRFLFDLQSEGEQETHRDAGPRSVPGHPGFCAP